MPGVSHPTKNAFTFNLAIDLPRNIFAKSLENNKPAWPDFRANAYARSEFANMESWVMRTDSTYSWLPSHLSHK